MSTNYFDATGELEPYVEEVLGEHRDDLREAEVRLGLRFAVNAGDTPKPALTLNGYPCLATVKIVALKDRAIGMPDAIIDVDGDRWPQLGERRRLALIHHELTHLVVVRKSGRLAKDPLGRPKLKMRLHDAQVGIFKEMVDLYGRDGVDAAQVHGLEQMLAQQLLPFQWGTDAAAEAFARAADPTAEPPADDEPEATADRKGGTPSGAPEAPSGSVEDLDLQPYIQASLAHHGMRTVADLQRYARDNDDDFSGLAGIGRAGSDAILDALDAWMAEAPAKKGKSRKTPAKKAPARPRA